MHKKKGLWQLFLSMLKIGLFTFGGGYAMISILENEFVSTKKWIDHEEFIDLVAVAESTPGPIAVNMATYIGYKTQKLLGSIVATLGIVIPSFLIIFTISLFFDAFLSIKWVASAFKGIQVCVIYLIASAGVKMFKKIKKNVFTCIVMSATFLCMLLLSLFAVKFSSIFYILISGSLGLMVYAVGYIRSKKIGLKQDSEVE